MYMTIQNWGSPVGIGYELNRGWGTVKNSGCLVFGKDVARTREEATDELPFAGDVIQKVINENNITNGFNIPGGFENILSDIQIPERTFVPTKGKAVWFPIENEIELTDPYSIHADPAMGYVKSVDKNGKVEIDVRQVYARTEAPNIVDESRKMKQLTGTTSVDAKYCFEKRMDCMDYIIAQSHCCNKPLFRVELGSACDKDFADAVANIPVKDAGLEQ